MTIQWSVHCLQQTLSVDLFCLFFTPLRPFFRTLIAHTVDVNKSIKTHVGVRSIPRQNSETSASTLKCYVSRLIFSQRLPMEASLVLMRLWSHFTIRLLSLNERQWKAHHQQVSRSKSLKPFFTFTLRLRGICQEWLISSLRSARVCACRVRP